MSLKSILERFSGKNIKNTIQQVNLGAKSFQSDFIPHVPRKQPNITTLENGLRVVTQHTKSPLTTVGIFSESGSLYETEETNGSSVFLQNVSLRGTTSRSFSDIEKSIHSIGGSLNAFTTREQTSYIGQTLSSNVSKLVEVMSDVIQNPRLDANDIEIVRKELLEEKARKDSCFEETILDFIHSAAFQGTSLSFPVLGHTESIQSITKKTLEETLKSHLSKQRLIVSAYGDVDHDSFVSLMDKSFQNLQSQSSFDVSKLSEFEFIGSEITVNDNTMKSVYGSVAFEAPSLNSADYIPFLIIRDFIGQWDRSMGGGNSLVPNLSEVSSDRDLCISYKAFTIPYQRTGLFGIYYVTPYDKSDDFGRRLMQELSSVRGMTESELMIAKARVTATYLMEFDHPHNVTEHNGRQLDSMSEFLKKIDEVTLKDVVRVHQQYLRDVDPVVAAYGNLKYYPDYNNFRSWT